MILIFSIFEHFQASTNFQASGNAVAAFLLLNNLVYWFEIFFKNTN